MREELINYWATDQGVDYFLPLGQTKLNKLVDFLSSMDAFHKLIWFTGENNPAKEGCRDFCQTEKLIREKYHFKFFNKNRQEACRHYTYFKKIIDVKESFAWDDLDYWESLYTTDQLCKLITKHQAIKPKTKKRKPKKKAETKTNVVNFLDYKKKSA